MLFCREVFNQHLSPTVNMVFVLYVPFSNCVIMSHVSCCLVDISALYSISMWLQMLLCFMHSLIIIMMEGCLGLTYIEHHESE